MSKGLQTFERLIRIEDEELDSNDNITLSETESCRVPMIPNGSNIETIFNDCNKQIKSTKSTSTIPALHFTINGRHIQMNPDQLKYLSLITLTVQNAALNLTMRAARTQKEVFSTSVAVTVAEILKLITCLVLILYEEVTVQGVVRSIKANIIYNYKDTLKVAIPSFVYYVQNNLLYVGSTHLGAATCQVVYQLKILTTAIFSVLMLSKKLSNMQWAALVFLFVGVALIETIVVADNTSEHFPSNHVNSTEFISETPIRQERPTLGFVAILVACCLSGFAGVYFEKILKNSHVSLWIRNIQLCSGAIIIGLLQIIFLEYDFIATKGLWYGFTPITWLCICLQVQGGLLVAVVVKFANNILKGFATSMAIIISTFASIYLFNFQLTPSFLFGASLVISSVMMYNKQ